MDSHLVNLLTILQKNKVKEAIGPADKTSGFVKYISINKKALLKKYLQKKKRNFLG